MKNNTFFGKKQESEGEDCVDTIYTDWYNIGKQGVILEKLGINS